MIYREGYSILGLGCMRLPGNFDDAEKVVMASIDSGINYFDTAYTYPGNETLLGKIIEKNDCRDKMTIATKLPHYLIKREEDIEKYFSIELTRLKTDYVDNYLMHMLPDLSTWERLKKLGIENWIKEKKDKGQIRKIGFSFHGDSTTFIKILEAYDWDFVQIQYNYMDEHSQAGKTGLMAANEKGIPVIIMEPLRGGNLTKGLCEEAKKIVKSEGKTPAEIGLTWLYNQPQVTCVLSGMSDLEMLKENVELASTEIHYEEKDYQLIEDVKKAIDASLKIGCTACSYCMPCPVGVNIPGAFRCFNVSYTEGYSKGFQEYLMCTTLSVDRSNASKCIRCGKCENHCPQHLPIRENLKMVRKRFEHPAYKIVALVAGRLFNRK